MDGRSFILIKVNWTLQEWCTYVFFVLSCRIHAHTHRLLVGGGILANPDISDLEFLFSKKSLWQEKSSNEIHILKFNLSLKEFVWTQVEVPAFEPRAFHSAILIDRFTYIFGGLNLESERRYSISPVRINIYDWTLSTVDVGSPGLGYLAGAGSVSVENVGYLVGGYSSEICRPTDKATDQILEVSFSSQGL